jgi:hypothetical protein
MRPESTYSPVAALEPLLFIPRILFLDTQFGITDLIFMVALMGNAMGLVFHTFDVSLAPFLCVPIGLLVLNGATWGLWTATRVHEPRVLQRWWLMLLGVLFPIAVFGIPVSLGIILVFTGMGTERWPQILAGLVVLPTCICLTIETLIIQRQAQHDEETTAANPGPGECDHDQ